MTGNSLEGLVRRLPLGQLGYAGHEQIVEPKHESCPLAGLLPGLTPPLRGSGLAQVTEGVPQFQICEISEATFLAIEDARRVANVIVRAPRLQVYAVPRSTFDRIEGSIAASPTSEGQTVDCS